MYAFHPYDALLVVCSILPFLWDLYGQQEFYRKRGEGNRWILILSLTLLDKYLYGATDYNKIPLCKILYLVRVTGLITE
jgi:hypothetical protein